MTTLDRAKGAEAEIRELDGRIEDLEELIERKRSRLEGGKASVITDTPRGGKSTDWTNTVALIMEYQEELAEACRDREILRGYIREAKELIYALEDGNQRTALSLYYLRGLKWPKIALAMGCDERTLYRWRDSALEKLQK